MISADPFEILVSEMSQVELTEFMAACYEKFSDAEMEEFKRNWEEDNAEYMK